MTTRQNINIDTLEGFRTFLNDNPDKGKLHLERYGVRHISPAQLPG